MEQNQSKLEQNQIEIRQEMEQNQKEIRTALSELLINLKIEGKHVNAPYARIQFSEQ